MKRAWSRSIQLILGRQNLWGGFEESAPLKVLAKYYKKKANKRRKREKRQRAAVSGLHSRARNGPIVMGRRVGSSVNEENAPDQVAQLESNNPFGILTLAKRLGMRYSEDDSVMAGRIRKILAEEKEEWERARRS